MSSQFFGDHSANHLMYHAKWQHHDVNGLNEYDK